MIEIFLGFGQQCMIESLCAVLMLLIVRSIDHVDASRGQPRHIKFIILL